MGKQISSREIRDRQEKSAPKSSPMGLYIVAALVPLVGVIWGVIWWTTGDTLEKREWGKAGFWVAIVCWFVTACIIAAMGADA